MVTCPTAKSFCGCCHLRVPCIVIAVLRMVVYIIAVLAFLYFFVFLDGVFKEKPNRYFKDGQVDVVIKILFFVVSVNIFVTVLFIVGVKSNNPAKMEYYVVAVGTNAILLMFLFKLILFILAILECFVFICSYSLYKEYSSLPQVAVNVAYTIVNDQPPPPQYQSIGSDMEGQTAGIDLKQNP